MESRTLNWRQFLGAINLRDFSGMVLAELALIGMSARAALRSFLILPRGPFVSVAILLLAVLRLVLLALVVVILGTALSVTTAIRTGARIVRSRTAGG